jgi:septum formation protein
MQQDKIQLVLASSSPRRQIFLRRLGLEFVAVTAGVDETPDPGEGPVELAARLAVAKANAVAATIRSRDLDALAGRQVVLAADTVVAIGTQLLGKPADAAEAREMLLQLRGRAHHVHTGVAVMEVESGRFEHLVNSTTVWMRNYSEKEIEQYVATGDPFDKAGAYAIQHPDFAPVEAIDGCSSGVIGLPLGTVVALLRPYLGTEWGERLELAPVCEAETAFRCCQGARQGRQVLTPLLVD